MGRAPCCDKANVKRGPWSPEEDAKLKSYIEKEGTGNNWIALPQKIGLKRCGKSCRLRWLNYLRPNIRHGFFSDEEDDIICTLYLNIGSRWSIIAAQLPGRTDNDIKNYWNTKLKNKLHGKQRKQQQATRQASHAMVKQEVKREEESFNMIMAPQAMNLYPSSHWPNQLSNVSMSIVNAGQEPYIKNQESLKNLLIKLGGNFSNDFHDLQQNHLYQANNFQYPFDIPSDQPQPLDRTSNISSPDLPNSSTPYIVNGDDFVNFQELNNWTLDQLNKLLYSGTTAQDVNQYDGLGSFSGVDLVNGSSGTTSSLESTCWGSTDHLSCSYPQLINPPMMFAHDNYENCPQGFVKDSSSLIEEARYFRFH